MTPVRILVVRFSSIGDMVLTSPVVRHLKKGWPGDCEVHYITKKKFRAIVDPNPYIDRVFAIEKSTNEVLEELQEQDYAYIIDLHNNIRSSILKRKLGLLAFTFKKLNFRKWLLVNFGIDKMPDVHVVDRYMDTLRTFDIPRDEEGLDYFIPEDQEMKAGDFPVGFDKPYIAIAIGAQHWRKKLPKHRLVELCQMLDHPIALLGGPDDMEVARDIAEKAGDHVWPAAGHLSLHQSASVVRQSAVVISHDTGLMHIAAAFGKPVISVWGATVPQFGMYPYKPGPNSVMVQADHLKKRPCSKLGTRCKYRKCRCVEEIDLEKIRTAAERILP